MKLLEYYDKFENEIVSFSKSLSKNDWEDFIQHAWTKAITQKYIFETMNYYQVRSWFYKVIRNRFYDNKRKYGNLIFLQDIKTEFGAEDNINQFIANQTAMQFLQTLNETNREIVFLKYFQGKTSTQIGEYLNMNPSTIRYRLRKSLNIIKSKMNRSDYYD